MRNINCLIVDDEPLARKIIKTYLCAYPQWRLIKSCINAIEAYDALQEASIDVMFLDIRMPVISGIDFLRSLPEKPFVAFTTAYDEHAVTGFELNAVDYLVKPITAQRFKQAIEKIEQRLSAIARPVTTPASDYIFLKQDSRLVRVNYADIIYIEAKRDFTAVQCKKKKLLISMHLKALEAMLLSPSMVRIHRSYIVNIDSVQSIQGNRLETEAMQLPIGANYKDELFRKLGL